MRADPRADWTIADVERLCNEIGLTMEPPARGSHFKVWLNRVAGQQTLPARRPIKPVYIRSLVALADLHMMLSHGVV
jgi:hypothetical protein